MMRLPNNGAPPRRRVCGHSGGSGEIDCCDCADQVLRGRLTRGWSGLMFTPKTAASQN
jgi:hypothetical protein